MEEEFIQKLREYQLAPGYPYTNAADLYIALKKHFSETKKRKREATLSATPDHEKIRKKLSEAARKQVLSDTLRRNGNIEGADREGKRALALLESAASIHEKNGGASAANLSEHERAALCQKKPPLVPHVDSGSGSDKLTSSKATDIVLCDHRRMEAKCDELSGVVAAQKILLSGIYAKLGELSMTDPGDRERMLFHINDLTVNILPEVQKYL